MARGNTDIGTLQGHHRRGALAYGARAGQNHGLFAFQCGALGDLGDRGGGSGVTAITVQHHRDLKAGKEMRLHGRQ